MKNTSMKNVEKPEPWPFEAGLCPNARRFVPKSTKVCAQIHEASNLYNVHGLRGFGHKPSWIWAQTFVDLGTNLRGFGHKSREKPEPWPPDAGEKR